MVYWRVPGFIVLWIRFLSKQRAMHKPFVSLYYFIYKIRGQLSSLHGTAVSEQRIQAWTEIMSECMLFVRYMAFWGVSLTCNSYQWNCYLNSSIGGFSFLRCSCSIDECIVLCNARLICFTASLKLSPQIANLARGLLLGFYILELYSGVIVMVKQTQTSLVFFLLFSKLLTLTGNTNTHSAFWW